MRVSFGRMDISFLMQIWEIISPIVISLLNCITEVLLFGSCTRIKICSQVGEANIALKAGLTNGGNEYIKDCIHLHAYSVNELMLSPSIGKRKEVARGRCAA